MNDTTRAAFLALIPARNGKTLQETLDRVEAAIRVIEAGTAAGSILNVDFQDAKLVLDRSIEEAWGYGRKGSMDCLPTGEALWAPENKALLTLTHDVHMSYVRDAIASSKKLAKTKVEHAWVESARAFVAAVLPLAEEMEALKANIVKGRRPPTAEVLAARAAKAASVKSMARAQCGCCFADQAVFEDGRMHDHGYRKPHAWHKQGSCRGWGVQALHLSDQGPKLMVADLEAYEASTLRGIENLKAATKLSVQRGHEVKNGQRIPKFEDIEVGHVDFERTREYRIRECESNLRGCRADLAIFRKVVAEWKPGYQYVG